jgi:MoaA/NifB/PqqE/SkfB family radical SAM enzyme
VTDINNFPHCVRCFEAHRSYYNQFHKLQTTPEEVEAFLSADRIPPNLVIELTIVCNLKCKGCPQPDVDFKKSRLNERTFIDVPILQAWLAPFVNQVQWVRLYNYGETFAHPQSIDFCSFLTAANPKMLVDIATNGLLLDTDDRMLSLIQAQPDVLHFSIHGASQASLEQYMGSRANFEKVLGILRRLITLRQQLGFVLPVLGWKYILFDWNDTDEEMARARSLAREIGVDFYGFEMTTGPLASKRYILGSEVLQALIEDGEYYLSALCRNFPKDNWQKRRILEDYLSPFWRNLLRDN